MACLGLNQHTLSSPFNGIVDILLRFVVGAGVNVISFGKLSVLSEM